MIDEYTSQIEDIISTYSKSPSKLQMELKKFLDSDYRVLVEDEAPFGDPKIIRILEDVKNGKPLDSAYIQAIDFSEDEHESIAKDVDEKLGNSEINFRKLLVEPMFISDWPVHKHEMVGHFEIPQIPADEIVEKGRISELCDPVTISMISHLQEDLPSVPAGLNYGELEKYFEDHPSEFITALKEMKELQGPSMDEYLDVAGTILEPAVVAGLVEHPEELPPRLSVQVNEVLYPDALYSITSDRDFGETDKGRAWKAILASRKISRRGQEYTEEQQSQAEELLKEMKAVENNDSDRYPIVSFSQFSEALLQTGEGEGFTPEQVKIHSQFPNAIKIEKDNPLTFEDGLVIIMVEKTPEARVGKLDEIRGRLTKPGDFMKLYNCAVGTTEMSRQANFAVDQTAATNLLSNLSNSEVANFVDDKKRNSDKMEIPTGMDPSKNQNHKIRG